MGIFRDGKPIYVIDTNVLVDYPDIIPSEHGAATLDEPTMDLSKAHIVIPTAVTRELSSFKKRDQRAWQGGEDDLKKTSAHL